jgi:tripartite-type tricarboxylate transporter receptor subunit TctC
MTARPAAHRALACLLVALSALGARAESYPNRPITIIAPYPPGATNDLTARLVGPKLTESLGQPVVVENRSGASGNIGTALAARAAPDGYTLMVGNDATHATNVFLYKDLGFDPVASFAPITLAVRNIIGLAAHPSLPANDMAALIAYGRVNPDKLSYGSSGAGSPHHLAGELLQQLTGITLIHVPYRGGGPAVADLIGGQIPLVFASMAAVVSFRQAGKVKILAVVEGTRYAAMPDIPTIGETVPGFEMSSWLGFFAPAGTPAPIIDTLNRAIVAALQSDDVRGKLDPAGLEVVGSSAGEFAALIRHDLDRRGELIRSRGIHPE